MKDLLLLVHRIPYPPNKGDKIRSYHIFKYLAERFRIHLGTFIDDDSDRQWIDTVNSLCRSSRILSLNPVLAKCKSLYGLVTGEALSLRYYRNQSMQQWVSETVAKYAVRDVLVYSSAMAQFVPDSIKGVKLIDFVDVDSDKWRQYSEGKTWPMSWVYERESLRLLQYDRWIARKFDRCFFVSKTEAAFFKELAPESRDSIDYFNNGVDTDYFSPERDYTNPYTSGARVLVFTGAMDYWANVDAVSWFARNVFPRIRAQIPQACFYIVGSRPTKQVKTLEKIEGITVTGRVKDVRPYIQHASVAVASLRIARGIQNKVLEAMAMNKPIIATGPAMEGIAPSDAIQVSVSDDSGRLAEKTLGFLNGNGDPSNCRINREFVLKNYSWRGNLEKLDAHLRS